MVISGLVTFANRDELLFSEGGKGEGSADGGEEESHEKAREEAEDKNDDEVRRDCYVVRDYGLRRVLRGFDRSLGVSLKTGLISNGLRPL